MSRTLAADALGWFSTTVAGPSDALRDKARPDLGRFLLLIAQLALVLGVFRVFRVEQFRYSRAESDLDNFVFFATSCVVFSSFAIHYWLPFRFKEPFWIAISLLATALFFPPHIVVDLLGFGAVFYLVLSSRMAYRVRIVIVTTIFLTAMVACANPSLSRAFTTPSDLWPIFGSIFMFRLIVYAHDVRYMKERPSLREFLAYFFILPNYYFLLFPVVDFKTMRLTYYRRDIHEVAQQGIQWIGRGTLQLILYQGVNSLWSLATLNQPKSFGSLLWTMMLTFLLYLHVSGQFHIAVGMLHLFGYDLPETNHKYLLSRSLTDFWRRINIYWKDFMVKIVYFPVYFKFRKTGEARAKLLATAMVFVVTWFMHSYQSFWLRQAFQFSLQDTIFWLALGVSVTLEIWLEARTKSAPAAAGWRMWLRQVVSVAATMFFIITLWSLWNSPTVGAWLDMIRWWRA